MKTEVIRFLATLFCLAMVMAVVIAVLSVVIGCTSETKSNPEPATVFSERIAQQHERATGGANAYLQSQQATIEHRQRYETPVEKPLSEKIEEFLDYNIYSEKWGGK